MPYKTRKLKSGKVRVTGPGGVHAKAATPANAKKQVRLLQALEHNPEFRKKLKHQVMGAHK